MKPYWLYTTTVKEGTRPLAWGWAESADHALELVLSDDAFALMAKGHQATLSVEPMRLPPPPRLAPSFGNAAPF